MLIQFIVSIFVLYVLLRLIISFRQKKISFFGLISWTALWGVVLIIFWTPEIANRIADLLGIGRGSDVAIYVSIIIIFYLLYRIYMQLEKLNGEITKISRTIALNRENDEKNKSSDFDPKL